MFAVVRTGGKQYRVAPGDKIVVEKLAGETGDSIKLDDILLAGEGSDLKSLNGLIVTAEIIAQAKSDKVTVFKKRRRHNYRRKAGHRQQLTILRITAIGDQKAEKKPVPSKAEGAAKPAAEKAPKPVPSKVEGAEAAPVAAAPAKEAKAAAAKAEKPAAKPAAKAKAKAEKPAAKAAPAKPAPSKAEGAKSTKDAAPAKGASKTKTSKK